MISKFRAYLARRHNVRAHFWQSLANYSQQGFGLVLGVVLSRLLNPEDFGTFAYINAVVGLCLFPISWSLAGQIVPENHKNPFISSDALYLAWRILPLKFIFAFSVACFFGITRGLEFFIIALLVSTPLVLSDFTSIPRALLEAQGRFEINFLDSLLTFVMIAFPGVLLAYYGGGVWALVAPALPLTVFQIIIFSKFAKISLHSPQTSSGKSYWKSIAALWFYGAGDQVLSRADKFFLGKSSSLAEVGDYNRALNYGPISSRLLSSLVSNPTVAALSKGQDKASKQRLIVKSGSLLVIGGGLNFFVLFWFSEDLVPLIFGDQWRNAIPVFEAFAPMSLVLAVVNLPIAIALSKQRYVEVGISRFASVLIFMLVCLTFQKHINSVTMAILLQCAILIQLPILWITWQLRRSKYYPT